MGSGAMLIGMTSRTPSANSRSNVQPPCSPVRGRLEPRTSRVTACLLGSVLDSNRYARVASLSPDESMGLCVSVVVEIQSVGLLPNV